MAKGSHLLRQRLKVSSNLLAHNMQTFFPFVVSLNSTNMTLATANSDLDLIRFDVACHQSRPRNFSPKERLFFGWRATNCIWSSCTLRAEWAVLLNLLHDNTANLDKLCLLKIAGDCTTQHSISFCPAPSSLAPA